MKRVKHEKISTRKECNTEKCIMEIVQHKQSIETDQKF